MTDDKQEKPPIAHEKEGEVSLEEFLRKKAEIDKAIRDRFQRTISVMFTDVVASTEFFETHGDIEGRFMIQRYNDLLRPVIQKHNGKIIKTLGDGLMVVFGKPADGAHAAIEMQKVLAAENQGKRPVNQIWIRIGIHHGLGIVETHDVYGDVVNTSARICSAAKRGDILVSRDLINAIQGEPSIAHEFAGAKSFKGKVAPLDVHRILWDPQQEAALRRAALSEEKEEQPEATVLRIEYSLRGEKIRIHAGLTRGTLQAAVAVHEIAYRENEIKSLVEQIVSIRSSLNQQGETSRENPAQLKDLAKNLYEILVPRGLEALISIHPVQTLVIAIEDTLAFVPWELLHDGDNFLCLKYSMGRSPAIPEQATARQRPLRKEPLQMAVVVDPPGNLPTHEAQGINFEKDLKKGAGSRMSVSLLSREATCGFLRTHLADYDLFHFSGHFQYDSTDPSLSGFLLADGKFEAGWLPSISRTQPLPSLVFADARQWRRSPEVSPGTRLSGLASSFIRAGARHYIGTTTDLPDRSSASFAEVFYSRLLQSHPVGEALRQARLHCIRRYGDENLVWASYVLYGDPHFVYFPYSGVAGTLPTGEIVPFVKRKPVLAAGILLVIGTIAFSLYWYRPLTDTRTPGEVPRPSPTHHIPGPREKAAPPGEPFPAETPAAVAKPKPVGPPTEVTTAARLQEVDAALAEIGRKMGILDFCFKTVGAFQHSPVCRSVCLDVHKRHQQVKNLLEEVLGQQAASGPEGTSSEGAATILAEINKRAATIPSVAPCPDLPPVTSAPIREPPTALPSNVYVDDDQGTRTYFDDAGNILSSVRIGPPTTQSFPGSSTNVPSSSILPSVPSPASDRAAISTPRGGSYGRETREGIDTEGDIPKTVGTRQPAPPGDLQGKASPDGSSSKSIPSPRDKHRKLPVTPDMKSRSREQEKSVPVSPRRQKEKKGTQAKAARRDSSASQAAKEDPSTDAARPLPPRRPRN